MDKKSARKSGLQNRSFISEDVRIQKNREITSRAISLITADDIVGCYVSMKDEADTHQIIRYCFDHDIPVAVPKVVDNTLQFHRICSFDQLKEGTFGVSEPIVSCPVAVSDITLMFVPLSSYDDACHRTGYGKGYYDSVLNECGRKIGLAYSEQKMESIETDPWDVILDEIIAA